MTERDPMKLAHGLVQPDAYPMAWVVNRGLCGGRPPQSPLQLAQEQVSTDWQVVVASLLHVRTSRAQGHNALWKLLQYAPTPWHMMHLHDLHPINRILKPCGFMNKRRQTLMAMSAGWRRGDRPTEPGKLYGCGPYVVDSYMLFAHGDLRRGFQDGELSAYAVWCMRRKWAGKPYLLEYEETPSDMQEWLESENVRRLRSGLSPWTWQQEYQCQPMPDDSTRSD